MKKILNKHEIPEDLDDIERATLLLKKSDSVQRASVLINLPTLIRDHPDSQDVILPKIFKNVLSWDEDLQVECGASLAVIIEEDLFNTEMKQKFHIFMLEALESWNKAKWDVLWDHYIRHLDMFHENEDERATTINSFVDLWISLWDFSQAIPSRWTGARLMATLSNIIEKEVATKRLVPRLMNLCCDFNWEVRKAITGHLTYIFNLLSPEECDETFFDIMVDLLDDEENEVKNFAIEGFFQNIDKFSPRKVEENWIGIIIDLIKNESNTEFINDCIEIAIEKSEVLRKHFTSQEYLQQENTDLTLRILYNSHLLVKTLGIEYFMDNIMSYYQKLLDHEDEFVREKIATKYHELVKEFGTTNAYKNDIHKLTLKIMTDKSPHVQGELCIYLDQVAQTLLPENFEIPDEDHDLEKKLSSFKLTFLKTFLIMEDTVKSNWRHLIRWFDCLYKLLPLLSPNSIQK